MLEAESKQEASKDEAPGEPDSRCQIVDPPPPQSSSAPPRRRTRGEEDATLWAACEVIAKRKFRDRQGPPVVDRQAWLTAAAKNLYEEHDAKARTLLAAEPSLTPPQLATRLEGGPQPPYLKPFTPEEDTPRDLEASRAARDEARAVVGRG